MTFTVHTPSQVAFAEFVRKDPRAKELSPFYQQKRDLFLQLTGRIAIQTAAVRRHLLSAVRLFGDLAGERQGHRASPDRRARRGIDPGLGVSLQGHRRPGVAILLCEEGRDAARGCGAASQDLIVRAEDTSPRHATAHRATRSDHHQLPRSLQTAINSLLGQTDATPHSEVVGKRPARRLALDAPFCFRWRVASSRWLPLALQLTMIR